MLNKRYKVVSQIGKGVFGLVLKAVDTQEKNQIVAIKILRDSGEFREQAKRELEILNFINKVDHDKGFIVRTKDAFKHKKRNPCIVFERLEMNLYELMLQRK